MICDSLECKTSEGVIKWSLKREVDNRSCPEFAISLQVFPSQFKSDASSKFWQNDHYNFCTWYDSAAVLALAGGGRVRNAGLPVITGNTLLAVACEYCRRAPSDFGCPRGSRVQPRQGSDSSRRARDTAATMLDHSRHRGESATKTVKFFAAHTVNCVICKNLTRIEWMLLNFTPVIQQNCHQPGRNFEKSFCAVDRLSCQNPKPANSEAILFLIVNYVHVIFLHGG